MRVEILESTDAQKHQQHACIHNYIFTHGCTGSYFKFKSRSYMNLENMTCADLGCDNILGKHSSASRLSVGLCLLYVFISLVVRTHR